MSVLGASPRQRFNMVRGYQKIAVNGLKVCMLNPLFSPYFGGTEKVVLEVGSRLVKQHGYQVDVLTSMIPQAKGVGREDIRGLNVVRTPGIVF